MPWPLRQPSRPSHHANRPHAAQVPKGGQSAYAYEVLPLLHTLLATGRFLPARFADDALQFFAGTRDPINPGPAAWLRRWLGADVPPEGVHEGQGARALAEGDDAGAGAGQRAQRDGAEGATAAGVPGDDRASALVKVRRPATDASGRACAPLHAHSSFGSVTRLAHQYRGMLAAEHELAPASARAHVSG